MSPVLDLCFCTPLDSDLFSRVLVSRDSNDPQFVAADAAAWTSLCSESISSLIPINPACYTQIKLGLRARCYVRIHGSCKCIYVPALKTLDRFHQQRPCHGHLEYMVKSITKLHVTTLHHNNYIINIFTCLLKKVDILSNTKRIPRTNTKNLHRSWRFKPIT